MIVCDNCSVIVKKHTFCSDKCRVQSHRKVDKIIKTVGNDNVTTADKLIPKPEFMDIKKEDIADGIEVDKKAAMGSAFVTKWPTSKYGKPLSGRTAKCDTCYELCPIEFAQEHYQKEHADI